MSKARGHTAQDPRPGLRLLARVRPFSPTIGRLKVTLFDDLASWDNLLLAYRRAARRKRGRDEVARFEHRLEDNLFHLRNQLLTGSYRPGDYSSFLIHEPKRRLISAAPFRDRLVHHALCNIIEPIIEKSFVFDSYANRVGKGTHRALERAQTFSRRYRFVLQLDIRQFFPSIDHQILLSMLTRHIPDARVLELAAQILESGAGILQGEYTMVHFKGDDLFAALRPRGLPIGNLTSQFWANVYLSSFDHFAKRELRCPAYVRYVDDILLFSNEKPVLWSWRRAAQERLARLRLTIHAGAHPRPVTEGFPFLGFVVYPYRRPLKRRKLVQWRRRLRALLLGYEEGRIGRTELLASVRGWLAHARHGDTRVLCEKLIQSLPIEVQTI